MGALSARLNASLPVRLGIPSYQHSAIVRTSGEIPEGGVIPEILVTEIPSGFSLDVIPVNEVRRYVPVEDIEEIRTEQRLWKAKNIALSVALSDDESLNRLSGIWEIDGRDGYRVMFVRRMTVSYEVILREPYE